MAAILAECFVMAQRIGNISFQHYPRDTNKVAHTIARHVYDSNYVLVWDGDPPSFIMPLLIDDLTISISK